MEGRQFMERKRIALAERKGVLTKLFFSTLYLSAFTFGGGYVIVTLLKRKFVDEYHWIEEDEMLDLVAIAQSAPGAIAVNGAIVVGYKLAGLLGVVTAITATDKRFSNKPTRRLLMGPPNVLKNLPINMIMKRLFRIRYRFKK